MRKWLEVAALALMDLANAAILIWLASPGTLARAVLIDLPRDWP